MNKAHSLLHASLLAVSIVFLSSGIAAQDRAHLPAGLTQGSSLPEILHWLDEAGFPGARVGLKIGGSQGFPSSPNPDWQEDTPGYRLVFSQGFRRLGIEGCTLTLRNEDAFLVDSSKNIKDTGTHDAAELYVELDRLSPTRGRGPYLHTKNPEKVRLLGAWGTEYKQKGFFKRAVAGLALFSRESKKQLVLWEGEAITFTFDSRETSEKFDAAFRQAIRLCAVK